MIEKYKDHLSHGILVRGNMSMRFHASLTPFGKCEELEIIRYDADTNEFLSSRYKDAEAELLFDAVIRPLFKHDGL